MVTLLKNGDASSSPVRPMSVPPKCAQVPGEDRWVEVLRYLVSATRGGGTRGRIIRLLLECPRNASGLARALGLNYGTVRAHLRLLEESGLVVPLTSSRYGRGYSVLDALRRNPSLLGELPDPCGTGNEDAAVRPKLGRRPAPR